MVAGRDCDLGRDVRRAPVACPDAVAARIHEDAVEPGLEPGGITERGPLPPSLDERVMCGVLCLGGIAEDRPREAIRLVEMLVRQSDEGGIAEICLGDACRYELGQLDDL